MFFLPKNIRNTIFYEGKVFSNLNPCKAPPQRNKPFFTNLMFYIFSSEILTALKKFFKKMVEQFFAEFFYQTQKK